MLIMNNDDINYNNRTLYVAGTFGRLDEIKKLIANV